MEQLKLDILSDPIYRGYDTEVEFGWGRSNKIMFIGQNPSRSNMTGKRGDSDFDLYFLKMLEPMHITKKDFYFTNLIKRPIDMDSLMSQDYINAIGYLKREVEIVQPEVIITLGSYAKKWFSRLNINFYSLTHPSATRYGSITEDIWKKRLKDILSTNKLMKKNYEV